MKVITKSLIQRCAKVSGIWLRVETNSMSPFLHVGNKVFVRSCRWDKLSIGDLVLFYSRGNIVTHRIVFIDGEIIRTKGDCLKTEDIPVKKDQIIGKVILIRKESIVIDNKSRMMKILNPFLARYFLLVPSLFWFNSLIYFLLRRFFILSQYAQKDR